MRLRPIPPGTMRPEATLPQRFAGDRDLVRLKVVLLVGLGLLAAALDLVT